MSAVANDGRSCAWVTGASSGLGRALALRLARDGWCVAASARRREALETLAAESKDLHGWIEPVPLDVTDGAAVEAAVAEIEAGLGPIELAVLNAGTHKPMLADEFTAAAVRDLIEINVMGTVYGLDQTMRRMIARRRGRIAVVASLAGYCGLPSSAAYGLTKAGLINLCEALRPDLARHGVMLQLVNPGFVRTPLTDRNDFPMPFLMELDDAAEAFHRGLQSDRFEVTFPWRLALTMKLLRLLPYGLFFRITRGMVRQSGGANA